MLINYNRTVEFSSVIINVGLNEDGLITCGQKTSAGAPAATVGKYIAAAIIQNIATGIIYQNTGTTASPVWTAMATGGGLSSTLPSGQIFVGNAGNVATGVAVSGDITMSNTGVVAIAAGVIVNADINAAAGIDFSKLATLASANILVGSVGGVPTSVAVTGDVTISNTGVTSIAAGAIVNADINAAAGIDFSKLAGLSSGNILVGSVGGVATSVAMSGDATILASGAVSVTDLSITGEAIGDILYFNGTNWVKLAIGTAGQVLTVNGGGTAPSWV